MDEQNRHQTVWMDAAVLRMDTSSCRTDAKTIWMDAKTIQRDAAVLRTHTSSWRTDAKTVWTDVDTIRTDVNVFWTYMQTVQQFVEQFEQIFLGVWMDDEQITNGLPDQTDNH